jgi:hypothetical protein
MSMTPAVHCEVRKIAYRQSKEGLVVSFVVHPDEMPASLATAPLGQRYMLALAAIGDDETPAPILSEGAAPPAVRAPSSDRANVGKARYVAQSPEEQAVTRAALLPKDPKFREWLAEHTGWLSGEMTEEDAAWSLRHECSATSRREIATDVEVYRRFIALETAYLASTGQMAEARR